MVYFYKKNTPDGVHDDCVAFCVLLMWQGVVDITIERGALMKYGVKVDAKEIRRCMPYYLGEVRGFAPNKKVVRLREMLSGDIP